MTSVARVTRTNDPGTVPDLGRLGVGRNDRWEAPLAGRAVGSPRWNSRGPLQAERWPHGQPAPGTRQGRTRSGRVRG